MLKGLRLAFGLVADAADCLTGFPDVEGIETWRQQRGR